MIFLINILFYLTGEGSDYVKTPIANVAYLCKPIKIYILYKSLLNKNYCNYDILIYFRPYKV